jgi:hypothetical protein
MRVDGSLQKKMEKNNKSTHTPHKSANLGHATMMMKASFSS